MAREADGAKSHQKEPTGSQMTDENHLARLVDLGIALSAEQGREELNQKILMAAREFTNADGGSLYLVNREESELHFRILVNDTLDTFFVSGREAEKPFPPLPLYDDEGRPNYRNIATYVALSGKAINIEDAYCAKGFDFSGTRAFDAKTGYRSKSFLTVPLKNTRGTVIGVLQLINARDDKGNVIAFDPAIEPIINALASQAAVAIENSRLLVAQRDLMESFVHVLGHAIDAKSPHTADHCSRVPVIARMLAQAAVDDKRGPFSNFYLTDMEWYELDLAAWLHDCGKIVTPDHVIEKATKLETIHNRIHEIRTRFEVLRRDAEIDMLKRQLAGEDAGVCEADFNARVSELEAQFALVADANIGDAEIDTDAIYALHDIAEQKWTRHFDRTLGLSWAENERLSDTELATLREPGPENLLMDREDHIYQGFNRGELYNLSVPHGTLTSEERQVINDHVVITQDMLAQLPYPRELQRIPAIAGNHHEKMDGSGYPRGLTGDDMGILEKVMVIADIFEALTAVDRPYKRPKLLSECIAILADMRDKGQIDNDLFELFLVSGTYLDYGRKYLRFEQCDEVDIEQFILSK
ncbi:GAF and HD-GYP domain-containing protein [Thalassospira povalilytica]|uniref:GAF domain-containing protein n=1 Tax=Thalassospira povalilytica TaxID=732237 RepID=A0A8I1M7G2_9PROT|nr:HD domain-containing phosphohydrolase [Thalassospira povalilytica]MBN8196305.1 GAF domain-containing protein [Thalassospira povalilytica]